MRKNIDIPDKIVKDLKKLAIDVDMDLKNYIQDLLVYHLKGSNSRGFQREMRQIKRKKS